MFTSIIPTPHPVIVFLPIIPNFSIAYQKSEDGVITKPRRVALDGPGFIDKSGTRPQPNQPPDHWKAQLEADAVNNPHNFLGMMGSVGEYS